MKKSNITDSLMIDDKIRCVLKSHPTIQLAILFGSLAKGNARSSSDIDIAVEAARPLNTNEKERLIGELAVSIGRPVDLVDLFTAGEPLLGQIIAGGRKILGSDDRYATLMYKHLIEQADFMPLRSRILEERRRAWIGI